MTPTGRIPQGPNMQYISPKTKEVAQIKKGFLPQKVAKADLYPELPAHYPSLTRRQRFNVRNQYALNQGGKCHHCGEPLTGYPAKNIWKLEIDQSLFPPGFFKNGLHLHHDHKTGMTIGAVHAHCNAVLFQYHGE